MSWNDERVEQLCKLRADGLSCSQIAKQLGCGITRNAVIGKLHRLGLSGPREPSMPKPKVLRARPPKREPPVRAPDQRPAITAPPPVRVEAVRLTDPCRGACKWPIGDPREAGFGFCGAPAEGRYCAEHTERGRVEVRVRPLTTPTSRRGRSPGLHAPCPTVMSRWA